MSPHFRLRFVGREEARAIPLVLDIARSLGDRATATAIEMINRDLRDSHPGQDPRCNINLHVKPL